ncbi:HAMP domain-containing histidine kinase, partial [Beggiatoa alba]|nr:HAMP domain-containing histidine kinase [Beggiatoa alba]
SQTSNLVIAYQGSVLSALNSGGRQAYLSRAQELQETLLLHDRLSDPLGRLELIFSVDRLPVGPGGTVISWLSLILLLVLSGGFFLMYRLGLGQITLARQQQDFVSAVSHELKTPLTSIRMYGEMLREGWLTEDKRKIYYDYIYEESERLSRLINNVLQLASMTRNDMQVELKPCSVAQLMDSVRSKVASQIERAGFIMNIDCQEAIRENTIDVDADFFIQIVINLVDNAIKFSAKAEIKQIDINCVLLREGKLQFSVRDYGSGIPKDQMRKIFRLFYRSENELTRETLGTGIGLALVNQLAQVMHAQIDVVNQEPGAELRISFLI